MERHCAGSDTLIWAKLALEPIGLGLPDFLLFALVNTVICVLLEHGNESSVSIDELQRKSLSEDRSIHKVCVDSTIFVFLIFSMHEPISGIEATTGRSSKKKLSSAFKYLCALTR